LQVLVEFKIRLPKNYHVIPQREKQTTDIGTYTSLPQQQQHQQQTMVTAISTQQRYYQYSSTTPSIHSRTTQKPKPKMSLTQTYYLAHTARRKLSKEASRADHDLRILVSHANLLDNLMLELSNAEQEQQRWVDRTAVSDSHNKNRQFTTEEEQHIQWADQTTVEYVEESSEDSDSDSDSDYALSDDEDLPSPSSSFSSFSLSSSVYTASTTTLHRNTAPSVIITQQELLASDTEEDTERLALTRSPSHSPPELLDDLSDDSEEDVAPPSPPQPTYDIFHASGLSSKSNQKTSFIVRETETSPSFTAVTDDYISPHEPGTMIEAY
jgi:hypothetical protein